MRAWRNAQWVGSYLQRTGSTFSRDVTFRAAFRLTREALGDYQNLWSKTKGWIDHVAQVHGELIKELIMEQHWSHEDAIAYAAAKEVVENSHGNFQKMYRAASLRGGMRSLVLLYKNFAMQRLWSLNPLAHPDYVSVSQDPVTGAWLKKSTTNPLREASYVALASQAFAAGLLGLPGADLLKKLLDLALKYEAVTSRTGGTGKTADELFKTYLSGFDLPISANSLLYGMSHSLGGLFDLSSSLSLGNIVPGDPGDVAQVLSGKLPLSGIEALGRIGKDFGGVGASWIYNLVDTLQNDNPDWAKKLSEVAPHFSRGPLVTASAVRTGMETTLQGTPLISYDLTQPTAWAELTGRALGFTPTRLSEARAARTMQNAAEQYWTVREHEILQLYGRAFLAKDKELEKEASAAWDRMYDQVPAEFLRHLPKSSTIKESVKNYVLKHGSADYIPKAEVLAQEHYKEIEKAASLPHGGKVIQERVPGGR